MHTKGRSIFIFSELNVHALATAKSISNDSNRNKHDYTIYILSSKEDKRSNNPLYNDALGIGAIIQNIDLVPLIKKKINHCNKMVVLLMSGNEQQNLSDTLRINAVFAACCHLNVYCLAASQLAGDIIDQMNIRNHNQYVHPIRLRRTSPVRNEIFHLLLTSSLFEDAVDIHGEKWINIVIVGLDTFAFELLKAALWCGQMENYFIRIDVFDVTSADVAQFYSVCPGIKARDGMPRIGEDYYELYFHEDVSSASIAMFNTLDTIPFTSWCFVSLGNDYLNLNIAQKLREYYSGRAIENCQFPDHSLSFEQRPRIYSVIHSDQLSPLLNRNVLRNYRGQYYQIDCVGQDSSVYALNNIMGADLEDMALTIHLHYGTEEQFESFEYYRRSSMASAIHQKYCQKLIDNPDIAAIVEHRRWCAYMRSSEGYQYGAIRDDLAKRHPSLTSFDKLSKAEQEKDYIINGNEHSKIANS